MGVLFSSTEQYIKDILSPGTKIMFYGNVYTITKSSKPRPSSGECKTDVYIEMKDNSSNIKCLKISIKQTNADFLENKINHSRAVEIFGASADQVLKTAMLSIQQKFEDDYLVCFDKAGRTEAKTMKIGWKFELLNKPGGEKSGLMQLSHEQLMNVYAGINLSQAKKNCLVDGSVINNSGVADYILEVDPANLYTDPQMYINELQLISDYTAGLDVYFACKAVNYRAEKDKWDGDRPLSVYVDWRLNTDVLTARICLNEPLTHTANGIGENIRCILKELQINGDNFELLEGYLKNIRFYKA